MSMTSIGFIEYIEPQIKECIQKLLNGHMEYGIQFFDYYATRFSFHKEYNGEGKIIYIVMEEESNFVRVECKVCYGYDVIIPIFANAILTAVKCKKVLEVI